MLRMLGHLGAVAGDHDLYPRYGLSTCVLLYNYVYFVS